MNSYNNQLQCSGVGESDFTCAFCSVGSVHQILPVQSAGVGSVNQILPVQSAAVGLGNQMSPVQSVAVGF